jgi:hypothetical protein
VFAVLWESSWAQKLGRILSRLRAVVMSDMAVHRATVQALVDDDRGRRHLYDNLRDGQRKAMH